MFFFSFLSAGTFQIDEQVRSMVSESYERARTLLLSKRELVDRLSARLLHAEQLVFDDLREILGPRPFLERRSFRDIVADDERRQHAVPSTATSSTATTTSSTAASTKPDSD